jgi:hypothetical protein
MQGTFQECATEIVLPHRTREDVIAIGYTLGHIIDAAPPRSTPWKIIVNGVGAGGKSLIALAVEQFFNPECYLQGLHPSIRADDWFDNKDARNKGQKIEFFNIAEASHRVRYNEYKLSERPTEATAVVFSNTDCLRSYDKMLSSMCDVKMHFSHTHEIKISFGIQALHCDFMDRYDLYQQSANLFVIASPDFLGPKPPVLSPHPRQFPLRERQQPQ